MKIFLGARGKAFNTSLLLYTLRVQSYIARAEALTGIASTFLHVGNSAHSNFKLPLDLHNNSDFVYNVKRSISIAKIL